MEFVLDLVIDISLINEGLKGKFVYTKIIHKAEKTNI